MEFTKEDIQVLNKKIQQKDVERISLAMAKKDLEQIMIELKGEIRKNGWMNKDEYAKLVDTQVKTRAEILVLERKIQSVKFDISELKDKKKYIEENIPFRSDFTDLTNSIQSLKNKYADFSLDKTRIPAMRKITQEFSDELQELIDYVKELSNK